MFVGNDPCVVPFFLSAHSNQQKIADRQRIFALRAKRAVTAHQRCAIAALFIKIQPTQTDPKLSSAGVCPTPGNRTASCRAARNVQKHCIQTPAEESSGRMRKVWREKETHPKGVSFSLQGLPFPPQISYFDKISLGVLRRRVRAGRMPQRRQMPTMSASRMPASQSG